jgi:hypothetical protein
MPETPETHKEIVEIKKEVRDIKQTLDAEIHQNRAKWEELLNKTLENNTDLMRVLLAVDDTKSAKEIEKQCELYPMKCWRLLGKLERNGIVFKMEETKKGSPVYVQSRWYRILRLDEEVRMKLLSLTTVSTPA